MGFVVLASRSLTSRPNPRANLRLVQEWRRKGRDGETLCSPLYLAFLNEGPSGWPSALSAKNGADCAKTRIKLTGSASIYIYILPYLSLTCWHEEALTAGVGPYSTGVALYTTFASILDWRCDGRAGT